MLLVLTVPPAVHMLFFYSGTVIANPYRPAPGAFIPHPYQDGAHAASMVVAIAWGLAIVAFGAFLAAYFLSGTMRLVQASKSANAYKSAETSGQARILSRLVIDGRRGGASPGIIAPIFAVHARSFCAFAMVVSTGMYPENWRAGQCFSFQRGFIIRAWYLLQEGRSEPVTEALRVYALAHALCALSSLILLCLVYGITRDTTFALNELANHFVMAAVDRAIATWRIVLHVRTEDRTGPRLQ